MSKTILFLLALTLTTAGLAQYVPTPDSAMSFKLRDDPRHWTMVSQNGNRDAIIAEFTIDGEDINHWSEMVAQQIDFEKGPLEQYFARWVTMLKRADPKIVITEKLLDDGSILATYDSQAFDEVSVRRFIKGSDGIYALGYHVRHRLKQADVWARWTRIVSEATLRPNPMKKP